MVTGCRGVCELVRHLAAGRLRIPAEQLEPTAYTDRPDCVPGQLSTTDVCDGREQRDGQRRGARMERNTRQLQTDRQLQTPAQFDDQEQTRVGEIGTINREVRVAAAAELAPSTVLKVLLGRRSNRGAAAEVTAAAQVARGEAGRQPEAAARPEPSRCTQAPASPSPLCTDTPHRRDQT